MYKVIKIFTLLMVLMSAIAVNTHALAAKEGEALDSDDEQELTGEDFAPVAFDPYVILKKKFLITLSEGPLYLVQVRIALYLNEEDVRLGEERMVKVKGLKSSIIGTVNIALSDRSVEQMRDKSSIDGLRKELLKAVQNMLESKVGDKCIENLYFTEFAVQDG